MWATTNEATPQLLVGAHISITINLKVPHPNPSRDGQLLVEDVLLALLIDGQPSNENREHDGSKHQECTVHGELLSFAGELGDIK